MVLPDWIHPPRASSKARAQTDASSQSPQSLSWPMGRPLDRLAAAIVDVFVVIGPAYYLVSAPLKRWLTTSYVLGSEPDFALTILLMVALAAIMLLIYQTLCVFFFATTLGKRLFDLQVVGMFGERLSLWDCASRAVVWIGELLFFGLPWLAVFSNSKRRPMHDRVADTIVVSRHSSGISPPLGWEKGLVRSVFAVFMALGSLSFAIQIQGIFEKLKMDESFASLMAKEGGQCEAVNTHVENEGNDNSGDDEHARLKTAMILYAAGLVDTDCLESEVEREVRMQVRIGPLTYLAQAFVYADDAEVSNSYLDEVCEVAADTVECAMSRLVGAWSDGKWQQVESILKSSASGSGYLEVWGVRHYMKQAKYFEALDLLNSLTDHPELRDFSLVQRVKALYSLDMDSAAEVAYQQAFVALPTEDGKALSAWMCAQELQGGCKALEGVACRHTERAKDGGESINFELTNEAMAHVLALECGSKIDYLKLSDATSVDKPWQFFFRANLKREREDRSAAFDLFMKVMDHPQSPELLRLEAARRVMKFASAKQTEQLVERWNELESRETWVRLGNMLFPHLSEQQSPLALEVGRELMAAQSLSPRSLSLMRSLSELPGASSRGPASVKAKESVKKLMDALEEAE